jgi:competence protein ComEA
VPGIGEVVLSRIAPHLDLPPGPAPALERPAAGTQRTDAPPAGRLDLNSATADELRTLPGVGEVLAARIVQSRLEQGPFRSVEEVERVPGIGPRLRERIAPLVRAGP